MTFADGLNPAAFGAHLRHLREAAGWAQEDVARRLRDQGADVRTQSVTRWEGGRAAPSRSDLAKLAAMFGVSVEWLTEREAS